MYILKLFGQNSSFQTVLYNERKTYAEYFRAQLFLSYANEFMNIIIRTLIMSENEDLDKRCANVEVATSPEV